MMTHNKKTPAKWNDGFSGPRIGSVGASCFVDDYVSCSAKRGAYRLLLEPSFKVAFYDFVSSGGLIVCC